MSTKSLTFLLIASLGVLAAVWGMIHSYTNLTMSNNPALVNIVMVGLPVLLGSLILMSLRSVKVFLAQLAFCLLIGLTTLGALAFMISQIRALPIAVTLIFLGPVIFNGFLIFRILTDGRNQEEPMYVTCEVNYAPPAA